MKLNTEAFPYPVLSPYNFVNNDYVDTTFECEINIIKHTENKKDFIKFEYNILISNKEINILINNKKANCMLLITCKSTGFRHMYTLDNLKGVLSIPISKFYERVEVYPLIVSVSEVDDYTSEDLNPEFLITNKEGKEEYRKFKLKAGDLIAFDNPIRKYIDFKPLGLKSLLKVKLAEDIDPNTYSINPNNDDALEILMGSEFHALWYKENIQEYLHMAVIKDCILVALDEYRKNKDTIEERRWAKLFIDEIDIEQELNEETTVDDLNFLAQKMSMRFTLNKIKKKDKE